MRPTAPSRSIACWDGMHDACASVTPCRCVCHGTADTPTPGRPNFDSGLTDEETAAVVASARQTPERVTLTDNAKQATYVHKDQREARTARVAPIWDQPTATGAAAREQALREEIAGEIEDTSTQGMVTGYGDALDHAARIARGGAR